MTTVPLTLYLAIRDKLHTGDVLLFEGQGIISRLIQIITGNRISHVAMVYRMGRDLYCYESTSMLKGKNGVQISLLSNRLDGYKGKVWVRRMECNRDAIFFQTLRDLRQEFKGKKYERNLWELLGAALPWRNVANLETIFCSELIAEAFQRWGFLLPLKPANEYTPADFDRMDNNELYLAVLAKAERIK